MKSKKSLLFLTVFVLLLFSFLCIGCLSDRESYSVIFYINGEIYETVELDNSDFSMPLEPILNNYNFDGWYLDDQKWTQPFDASSLTNGSLKGNISVYSKWQRDTFTYSLINDDTEYEIIGLYDKTITNIVIPSSYNGLPVTSLGDFAFKDESIESIVIPECITNIGSGVFLGCLSLNTISVIEGNESFIVIDGNLYDKNVAKIIQYLVTKTKSPLVVVGSSGIDSV